MSWKHLNAAWNDLTFPDSSRKFVMIAIADMANEHGETWPSLVRLSERTNLSRSTVRRALVWLQSDGRIVMMRGNGRGKITRVQILQKGVTEIPFNPNKGCQADTLSTIKGVTMTHKGCHHDAKRCQALTPQPPDPPLIPQAGGISQRLARTNKQPTDYQLYWIAVREIECSSGATKRKLELQRAELAARMGFDTAHPPPPPPKVNVASNGIITKEELLAGAQYLVSIGKEDLLTDSQKEVLKCS